ncbi:MAG: hypothetical protein ACLRXG_10255 [Oscillospiraceae bacterium]|jgi:hypothetical protein|nr:hypothetical protein [Oscillospiraceae bacterium]UYI84515.1 MAG: hypothetical protein OGM61_00155 [Clostridiales bacterium]
MQSFFPAACTAEKILFRLQVWNLCAIGAQIMRAADCKPFVGNPEWGFRQVKKISRPVGG